ncbi:hypothetical protein QBC45DRAFT_469447 [Copromyces sp. CBS 386.78]|nr:hypothetical protein QBC45DRAFT_469447 [Copromyces sp. CBS 386.78]
MPFTRQSSSSRRSHTRANQQPPTLRRENAEVIYETVDDQGRDVELSTPVDNLVNAFNRTYIGHRHAVNAQAAPAGYMVNGRCIEPEPTLPSYTMNARSNEMTIASTPSESLPDYAEASNEQGQTQSNSGEATNFNSCNQESC